MKEREKQYHFIKLEFHIEKNKAIKYQPTLPTGPKGKKRKHMHNSLRDKVNEATKQKL